MEINRQDLADQLVDLMQQTHVLMRSGALEEWSDIELTMMQFRTLLLLSHEPQRMGSLASYLETGLSSTTSLVDRLVDKGLVERVFDPSDRRVVECKLTDCGQQAMEECWQIGRRSILEIADQLSSDELEIVVQAMKHLHGASLKVRHGVESSASTSTSVSTSVFASVFTSVFALVLASVFRSVFRSVFAEDVSGG